MYVDKREDEAVLYILTNMHTMHVKCLLLMQSNCLGQAYKGGCPKKCLLCIIKSTLPRVCNVHSSGVDSVFHEWRHSWLPGPSVWWCHLPKNVYLCKLLHLAAVRGLPTGLLQFTQIHGCCNYKGSTSNQLWRHSWRTPSTLYCAHCTLLVMYSWYHYFCNEALTCKTLCAGSNCTTYTAKIVSQVFV